ncbi:hypothetical protein C9374_000216 [Naegleria lovaniensis]|uniref:Uncharacterized protein n=1 Tax=Naegleria lovaniensis TaxID=51637 RepID=A0AA88GTU5_NAELO|nr:uncharacterized protein C9374_000216 [Naegleria lovaniensis]KAG2388777.1 hypothetical protein C9374_000216 [Naegleria lovaniensis]
MMWIEWTLVLGLLCLGLLVIIRWPQPTQSTKGNNDEYNNRLIKTHHDDKPSNDLKVQPSTKLSTTPQVRVDDQNLLCIERTEAIPSSSSSSTSSYPHRLSQLLTATITPELVEYASNVLSRRPSYLDNDVCGIRRDSYSTRTRSSSNHSFTSKTPSAILKPTTRVRATSWSDGMKLAEKSAELSKKPSKDEVLSTLVRYKFPSHA